MASRPRLFDGIVCTALMFALAACQSPSGPAATPTAEPQPTAVVNNAVWARVPDCNCFAGTLTDRVSAALKKAQLKGTVKVLNPTHGMLYFMVAYDPHTASREKIAAAIVDGGGEVVDGPP